MEKESVLELKFNINKQMTDYIIEIMKLKEKILILEPDSDEYMKLQMEFVKLRRKFIKEFQLINQDEINDYKRIKDQT